MNKIILILLILTALAPTTICIQNINDSNPYNENLTYIYISEDVYGNTIEYIGNYPIKENETTK
jgi:hypothetical protein